jgi:anti-anti-sigma regulatory factor
MKIVERITTLKIAPTEAGCVIRVEGDGTMGQSPAAREVAINTLGADPKAVVVFDLSACEYLDSTFLGCLMDVYRRFGRTQPQSYFIAANAETRKKLLGPTHIDRLIPTMDAAPTPCGPWVTVRTENLSSRELTRHVMECHQALADSECPMRGVFAKIVSHLERELAKQT